MSDCRKPKKIASQTTALPAPVSLNEFHARITSEKILKPSRGAITA